MRLAAKIVLVIVGAAVAASSYRVESSSRIHTDTLRHEWFRTTRVLGIPLARRERKPVDPFPGVYTAITNREPDPGRWMQRPVDNVRTLFGETDRCYAMNPDFKQCRVLMEAVYEQFGAGMPKVRAMAFLERIDKLVLPEKDSEIMLYYTQLDTLRRELGLKPILEQ